MNPPQRDFKPASVLYTCGLTLGSLVCVYVCVFDVFSLRTVLSPALTLSKMDKFKRLAIQTTSFCTGAEAPAAPSVCRYLLMLLFIYFCGFVFQRVFTNPHRSRGSLGMR